MRFSADMAKEYSIIGPLKPTSKRFVWTNVYIRVLICAAKGFVIKYFPNIAHERKRKMLNRKATMHITTPRSVSRRSFLHLFGAAGIITAGRGEQGKLFTGSTADHDPNLIALLSDCHVNGNFKGGDAYQRGRLEATVAEILRLSPLPSRAIIFGDLAWLTGNKMDYEYAASQLNLLESAGIKVTVGMGNHDRRSTFFEVYPEYAKTTKVPGRIVSVVDAGPVDFIMLDGLQGTDDRAPNDMGPVPGALCKDQQDWLLAELPKWNKPVFVCSHFPSHELRAGGKALGQLLLASPNVMGYIHGHDHQWYTKFINKNWPSTQLCRSLCLPSTGHWGDIGYALMRVQKDEAVVTLRERDFYYPRPVPQKPADTVLWKAIVRDRQGQTCIFPLPSGTAQAT